MRVFVNTLSRRDAEKRIGIFSGLLKPDRPRSFSEWLQQHAPRFGGKISAFPKGVACVEFVFENSKHIPDEIFTERVTEILNGLFGEPGGRDDWSPRCWYYKRDKKVLYYFFMPVVKTKKGTGQLSLKRWAPDWQWILQQVHALTKAAFEEFPDENPKHRPLTAEVLREERERAAAELARKLEEERERQETEKLIREELAPELSTAEGLRRDPSPEPPTAGRHEERLLPSEHTHKLRPQPPESAERPEKTRFSPQRDREITRKMPFSPPKREKPVERPRRSRLLEKFLRYKED